MTDQDIKTLQGPEAIDLWRAGKDAWNNWVEKNPIYNVSFAGVDFSAYQNPDTGITFEGYIFPKGFVDFSDANFGEGNVFFSDANFEEGNVYFYKANFGVAEVHFSGAKFGEGTVNFNEAQFGEGGVDFCLTNFGEGDVNFSDAKFGKGFVAFNEAKFGEGTVNFSSAYFGGKQVTFKNITFKGNADFSHLKGCDTVKSFSFRNTSFDKALMFSGDFGCVPDLVGTKTSHHVELSGLKCLLQREGRRFLEKATDKEDAARLRRLKELAENNKHHEAALRFHADEMRAKRWHETGRLASCLDVLFDVVSVYGQSIWRPVTGLVLLAVVFFFVPCISQRISEQMICCINSEALKTVIRDSLPFLPASRSTGSSGIGSILHQLLALVFVFLIGLGLRNRFRI